MYHTVAPNKMAYVGESPVMGVVLEKAYCQDSTKNFAFYTVKELLVVWISSPMHFVGYVPLL